MLAELASMEYRTPDWASAPCIPDPQSSAKKSINRKITYFEFSTNLGEGAPMTYF
tara:strand:+ start:346 stop:510 length:165 start_codon:yes stop_codon:yes gene_type:complete